MKKLITISVLSATSLICSSQLIAKMTDVNWATIGNIIMKNAADNDEVARETAIQAYRNTPEGKAAANKLREDINAKWGIVLQDSDRYAKMSQDAIKAETVKILTQPAPDGFKNFINDAGYTVSEIPKP